MPHFPWPPPKRSRTFRYRFRQLKRKLTPKSSGWPLQNYRTRRIRGRKGWAPTDVWNLEAYLSILIAETLEHLAKTDNSFPSDLLPLALDYRPTPEEWEHAAQSWVNWLNETAQCFREYHRLTENLEDAKAHEEVKKGLARLAERWPSLWD